MWTPPASVTEHQGDPLAADGDFFAGPPAGIGTVRTAHTSLKKGEMAKPAPVRAAIALGCGVAGFLLMLGFHRMTDLLIIPASLTGTPAWLWAGLIAVGPAYLGWRASAFQHSCNFAGDAGCAQYRCQGERGRLVQNSVFRFQDASAVSTRLVRRLKNGRCHGTRFYFYWHAPGSENVVFWLSGTHYADGKTPPARNLYNFGRAVESAWYQYAAPKIDAELRQQGFVKFHMGAGRWAVLGPGYIRIVEKDGNSSRCAAEDIGSAKLDDGYLTIRRKDARSSLFHLFNEEGVFGFNYCRNLQRAALPSSVRKVAGDTGSVAGRFFRKISPGDPPLPVPLPRCDIL